MKFSNYLEYYYHKVVVQLLSYVWLFVTPWIAAYQVFLSFTISQSFLKFMSIDESVILSNHLILCHSLLLCLQSFPESESFPISGSLHQVEVTQSCLTLCNPMDCSLPGSSVHGIFQAIVLEWIGISFSSGSSWPRY